MNCGHRNFLICSSIHSGLSNFNLNMSCLRWYEIAAQSVGLAALLFLTAVPVRAEPQLLGWLESVYLQPSGVRLRAKLDTGALTSSIHAEELMTFQQDGQLWVRFTIPYKDRKREPEYKYLTLERPVIRETLVKEHVGDSRPRYVVDIEFCLNGRHYHSHFTLADRSNFNYKILLGRRTLKNKVIVDPAHSFTAKNSCIIEQ